MSGSIEKWAWERMAIILPLAVAGAFCLSGAYLVGITIGLQRQSVIALFTVADTVNSALPIAALFMGVSLLGLGPLETTIKIGSERGGTAALISAGVSLCLSMIGLASFAAFQGLISWYSAAFVVIVPILMWGISRIWINFAISRVPADVAILMNFLILGLILSISIGASQAYIKARTGSIVVVTTSDGVTLPSHYALSIERGVVLLEPFGYSLVPWDHGRSVMWIEEGAKDAKIGD